MTCDGSGNLVTSDDVSFVIVFLPFRWTASSNDDNYYYLQLSLSAFRSEIILIYRLTRCKS